MKDVSCMLPIEFEESRSMIVVPLIVDPLYIFPFMRVPFFSVPLTKVRFVGSGSNRHASADAFAASAGDNEIFFSGPEIDILRLSCGVDRSCQIRSGDLNLPARI